MAVPVKHPPGVKIYGRHPLRHLAVDLERQVEESFNLAAFVGVNFDDFHEISYKKLSKAPEVFKTFDVSLRGRFAPEAISHLAWLEIAALPLFAHNNMG
jgi:hypothetical protein